MLKKPLFVLFFLFTITSAFSQDIDTTRTVDSLQVTDTVAVFHPDSSLRIINLNPYFTLHVDSTLNYQLQINKNPANYFWYLKNSPVGLRVNKDNGLLSFNANKSYFLSGKLKYDVNYKVIMGVQNLADPNERIDTSFTIVFYNTEIIPSKVKPDLSGTIWLDEGEPLVIRVLCETGSFPIENIITTTNRSIGTYQNVQKCNDEFRWTPSYDFVKESDSGKVKIVQLSFVGSTRFNVKDTATLRLVVREALNYPLATVEYRQVVANIERYLLDLKFTFLQLDRRLRKTRGARTTFDLTSATTSLTGTILSASDNTQKTGKILPSVGLALVPIKEAAVPNKGVDQNQATLVRSSIKRLEYILRDNMLIGERDWDIARKTNKLRDELKQVQMQLIDVPLDFANNFTEEELNRYFNSPKVNKKYRLSGR